MSQLNWQIWTYSSSNSLNSHCPYIYQTSTILGFHRPTTDVAVPVTAPCPLPHHVDLSVSKNDEARTGVRRKPYVLSVLGLQISNFWGMKLLKLCVEFLIFWKYLNLVVVLFTIWSRVAKSMLFLISLKFSVEYKRRINPLLLFCFILIQNLLRTTFSVYWKIVVHNCLIVILSTGEFFVSCILGFLLDYWLWLSPSLSIHRPL